VLIGYFALWFAVGVVLTVVFQVAHCAEEAEFPAVAAETGRMERSWAAHQVETTVDFGQTNRLLTWYVGGLNFQIEHHLFPQICHVHYPQIADIVRDVCAEHGVRYTAHPTFLGAISSHGQWLRRMGAAAPA
jgi:linoleoyl-CoA desaturase